MAQGTYEVAFTVAVAGTEAAACMFAVVGGMWAAGTVVGGVVVAVVVTIVAAIADMVGIAVVLGVEEFKMNQALLQEGLRAAQITSGSRSRSWGWERRGMGVGRWEMGGGARGARVNRDGAVRT